MRGSLTRAAALAALAASTLVAGCARVEGPTVSNRLLRVGVIFDIGGRGDRGFNDAAANGAERAVQKGNVEVRYAELGAAGDREAAFRAFAKEGLDVVVGVGFLASEVATRVAMENPNVRFAVVDFSLPSDAQGRAIYPPSNLAGLTFREEEGSFLVGALAATMSRTRTVGFVGGMTIPPIRRFEAGYEAGVMRVCPTCTVLSAYAGSTPDAFRNPARGRDLASQQYARGADVIFHASGETGRGVFEAAQASGRWAIGVDQDQSRFAPGRVLTSMLKRVDVAVYDVIEQVRDGSFRGGIHSLGLAEDGVGYVYDSGNMGIIPASARLKVEVLREGIIAGLIKVPTVR